MRSAASFAVFAVVLCLLPARAPAQATSPAPAGGSACQVEGVWELVSVAVDGKDQPLEGLRQMKMVSRGHFMWVGEPAKRDTIVRRTAADSLRAQQFFGGAGTYAVAGDAYTEQLDYFVEPTMRGQAFRATCRTERDRWTHTFETTSAPPGGGAPVKQTTVEVWRRVR